MEETAVAALALSGTRGAWCERAGLVRGYFDPSPAAEIVHAFQSAWRSCAPGQPFPRMRIQAVPEIDWLESFRTSARPIRVGQRLWVAPPGTSPPGGWEPAALVVTIVPGQGFGTGSHATTRALLRWLEAEPGFTTVLDVGTGSGVLALAALALGGRRAVGLDLDGAALENAAVNRCLNHVSGFELVAGSIDALREDARFDRVLANLDRASLERLLPALARHVGGGGRLGIAGLIEGEEDSVVGLAALAGLTLLDRRVEADVGTGDRWWSGWLGG